MAPEPCLDSSIRGQLFLKEGTLQLGKNVFNLTHLLPECFVSAMAGDATSFQVER